MDSSNNEWDVVNRVLGGIRALIGLFFPSKIESLYLYGSYANGDTHPASDLDLLIVLHSSATADTAQRLKNALRACSALSPIPIDATVLDTKDMADFGAAFLSDESILVMGEDIRPTLSYPSADFVAATVMHMAFAGVASLFPGRGPLPKPLAPTTPNDPWLGFARKRLRTREGHLIPTIKGLELFVVRIAQGLLGARTGRLIHPKREALTDAFRKHLEGNWAEYVETVLRRCRHEWQQSIPEDDEGRRVLRQLCEDAYRLAEWFLVTYREFLVAELQHPDSARRRRARRNVVRLPFPA